MITISFLKDENGKEQSADFIDDLVVKALDEEREDAHAYADMVARINFVLDYMRDIGVPEESLRTLHTKSIYGNDITLSTVVKELNHHPPLMEFRVGTQELGAFRAIFFYEEDDKGNQNIYFTKACIKDDRFSQEFEDNIVESERMVRNFFNDKD